MHLSAWLFIIAAPVAAETTIDIPHFARKYDLPCAQCHVNPPKLNEFGQAFLEAGYTLPDRPPKRTWPFAVWLSGRADGVPVAGGSRSVVSYVNRVEVISGAKLVEPWLSYFLEWRPWSEDVRSDGTLRDRSGRFEDLFLAISGGPVDVLVGQFRQVQQVDVSQRLSLSEPLVLSAGLPGTGDGSAREVSLRSFSPAMRSPSVRVSLATGGLGAWRWTNAVAIPMPGEFSLPLTEEARREASNELELRAKGVFLESYLRRGLATAGAHAFVGESGGRFMVNGITTGASGPWHWSAMAGMARVTSDAPVHGRWALEGEFFPSRAAGLGLRVEDRAGDGVQRAVLPHATVHFPGTRYTVRLTVEQRLQRGRNATLVELGTVF